MKTLNDAVIELSGVLPKMIDGDPAVFKDSVVLFCTKDFFGLGCHFNHGKYYMGRLGCDDHYFSMIGCPNDITKRAKELGFINGYRWGVEYKTDGKRPALPDDVVIIWVDDKDSRETSCYDLNWDGILSFKITDQRYKPADTSYLGELVFVIPSKTGGGGGPIGAVAPFVSDIGGAADPFAATDNGADWYDYDNQKSLRLPPVGIECLLGEKRVRVVATHYYDSCVICSVGQLRGQLLYGHIDNLRPLDHDRKAKAERKKVVNAAYDEAIKAGCVDFGQWLNHLYDKGFLKLPENKGEQK